MKIRKSGNSTSCRRQPRGHAEYICGSRQRVSRIVTFLKRNEVELLQREQQQSSGAGGRPKSEQAEQKLKAFDLFGEAEPAVFHQSNRKQKG